MTVIAVGTCGGTHGDHHCATNVLACSSTHEAMAATTVPRMHGRAVYLLCANGIGTVVRWHLMTPQQ